MNICFSFFSPQTVRWPGRCSGRIARRLGPTPEFETVTHCVLQMEWDLSHSHGTFISFLAANDHECSDSYDIFRLKEGLCMTMEIRVHKTWSWYKHGKPNMVCPSSNLSFIWYAVYIYIYVYMIYKAPMAEPPPSCLSLRNRKRNRISLFLSRFSSNSPMISWTINIGAIFVAFVMSFLIQAFRESLCMIERDLDLQHPTMKGSSKSGIPLNIWIHMGVSWKLLFHRGIPKSSTFMGFPKIGVPNHPF